MIPNISIEAFVRSLKNSVMIPVHDPISFDFEEQVRAKAEAAKGRRFSEVPLDFGGEHKTAPGGSAELPITERREYIYDYNLAAELAAIGRKKDNKQRGLR